MVCLCGMVCSGMIGYAVAQYVILKHGVVCEILKRKLHIWYGTFYVIWCSKVWYVMLLHGMLCGTLKRKLHEARRVRLLVQPSQVMTA